MSWPLSYRLNALHQAVSIALLCTISTAIGSTAANAATIGKTTVSSTQYEPLRANIEISDIRADDFAASLASSSVYQQMGLTPTASMSVRFVPTSNTAGQLLINTSQPVSTPFADIILTINDGNQRNVVPKTLLMPLSNGVPIKPSNRVIASAPKPNLPVVSASKAMPLAVKRGAPPPLFTSPAIQTLQNNELTNATSNVLATDLNTPTRFATSTVRAAPLSTLPTSSLAQPVQNKGMSPATSSARSNLATTAHAKSSSNTTANQNSVSVSNTATNSTIANPTKNDNLGNNTLILNTNEQAKNAVAQSNIIQNNMIQNTLNQNSTIQNRATPIPFAPPPIGINVQQNILNKNMVSSVLSIQETRQIRVADNSVSVKDKPLNIDVNVSNTNVSSANNTSLASKITDDAIAQTEASSDLTLQSGSGFAAQSQEAASASSAATPITYTVQRNDNLWVISKQLAEQNNLDVQTVMRQIQAQNPDAFIDKNASLLKADTPLSLPSYEVVPSQQSLQSAITAQKETNIQTKPLADKTSKALTNPINSAQNKVARKNDASKSLSSSSDLKPKTTTRTLPQAQFSVIAPGRQGNADGTQTKSSSATGNGLSPDVLSSLKSSRQRTAEQVKKVKATTITLGSYTQKLQLQNQKLAELEARLKKLRNQ